MNREGRRVVAICAEKTENGCLVQIRDEGKGIGKDIMKKLWSDQSIGNSIGLSNVHKRMKSIYGEENGLHIISSGQGTCVELHFVKKAAE